MKYIFNLIMSPIYEEFIGTQSYCNSRNNSDYALSNQLKMSTFKMMTMKTSQRHNIKNKILCIANVLEVSAILQIHTHKELHSCSFLTAIIYTIIKQFFFPRQSSFWISIWSGSWIRTDVSNAKKSANTSPYLKYLHSLLFNIRRLAWKLLKVDLQTQDDEVLFYPVLFAFTGFSQRMTHQNQIPGEYFLSCVTKV